MPLTALSYEFLQEKLGIKPSAFSAFSADERLIQDFLSRQSNVTKLFKSLERRNVDQVELVALHDEAQTALNSVEHPKSGSVRQAIEAARATLQRIKEDLIELIKDADKFEIEFGQTRLAMDVWLSRGDPTCDYIQQKFRAELASAVQKERQGFPDQAQQHLETARQQILGQEHYGRLMKRVQEMRDLVQAKCRQYPDDPVYSRGAPSIMDTLAQAADDPVKCQVESAGQHLDEALRGEWDLWRKKTKYDEISVDLQAVLEDMRGLQASCASREDAEGFREGLNGVADLLKRIAKGLESADNLELVQTQLKLAQGRIAAIKAKLLAKPVPAKHATAKAAAQPKVPARRPPERPDAAQPAAAKPGVRPKAPAGLPPVRPDAAQPKAQPKAPPKAPTRRPPAKPPKSALVRPGRLRKPVTVNFDEASNQIIDPEREPGDGAS